jgi:hypothetical protein
MSFNQSSPENNNCSKLFLQPRYRVLRSKNYLQTYQEVTSLQLRNGQQKHFILWSLPSNFLKAIVQGRFFFHFLRVQKEKAAAIQALFNCGWVTVIIG